MRLSGNLSGARVPRVKADDQLVFDDEPLEAILYGVPGPGPSSADLFAEGTREVIAIGEVIGQEDHERALDRMVGLFETGTPLPADALTAFVAYLRRFIPACPCPLVEEHGVPYDRVLKPCFEAGRAFHNAALLTGAGTPLYRWYESNGAYGDAGEVIALLLEQARRKGDLSDVAVLTNNLGYEYLLAERWKEAAPYFRRSIALFERLGDRSETVNIRSNSLTCEAGEQGIESLAGKRKELMELARVLRKHQDWRARKPLGLLARIFEHEGKYRKAIGYARLAVKAGQGIPSRLHSDDERYLAALEAGLAG